MGGGTKYHLKSKTSEINFHESDVHDGWNRTGSTLRVMQSDLAIGSEESRIDKITFTTTPTAREAISIFGKDSSLRIYARSITAQCGGLFNTVSDSGNLLVDATDDILIQGKISSGTTGEVVFNAKNLILTPAQATGQQVVYAAGSGLRINAAERFDATGYLRTDGGDILVKARDISIQNTGGQAAIATYGSAQAEKTATVQLDADTILIKAEGVRDAGSGVTGPACAIEMAPVGEKFTSKVNINAGKSLTVIGDIRTNYFDGANSTQQGESHLVIGSRESNAAVTIVGDVYNGPTEHAQDTGLRSTVEINLAGRDSSLTGGIHDGSLEYGKPEGGVSLRLDDGAAWSAAKDSIVKEVRSSGGVIAVSSDKVRIGELGLEKDGAQIRTASAAAGQVEIDKVTGEGLQVVLESAGTDQLTGRAEADQKTLAELVSIGSADAGYTVSAEEGAIIGASTLMVGADGSLAYREQVNTVTQGLLDIASLNFLQVRSQVNDLQKRMGDLRSMPAKSGAWARYYGGQSKYGSANLRNRYSTIQVGADGRIADSWVLGGTMSYTDDDGKLLNGTSDGKQYSFGLYGSWLGEDGQYADLIVKRTRVDTEFDLSNLAGLRQQASYHNWANSISLEYGRRFSDVLIPGAFVEPQAELSYAYLTSASYRTSAGAGVHQSAMKSAIGRLGAAFGYAFPKSAGSAYLRASVLHEFAGEARTTLSYKGQSRSISDDLGGTWGEVAAGLAYNFSERLSAYGEVQTAFGSPIRSPWQASAGLRLSF